MQPIIIRFGANQIEIFPDSTRVTLPDGATILGMPEDTDEYRKTASDTGYNDDTLRLCHEHELAHLALCDFLGLSESPTMRMVASGSGQQWIADAEEAAVLALQNFANAININLIELFENRLRSRNEVTILVSRDSL
jgi:hypothetical protein